MIRDRSPYCSVRDDSHTSTSSLSVGTLVAVEECGGWYDVHTIRACGGNDAAHRRIRAREHARQSRAGDGWQLRYWNSRRVSAEVSRLSAATAIEQHARCDAHSSR